MESRPQNPEFRIYPENFHPCRFWQKILFCLLKVDKKEKIHIESISVTYRKHNIHKNGLGSSRVTLSNSPSPDPK